MFVLVVLSFDEKGTVRKLTVLTEGGGLVPKRRRVMQV